MRIKGVIPAPAKNMWTFTRGHCTSMNHTSMKIMCQSQLPYFQLNSAREIVPLPFSFKSSAPDMEINLLGLIQSINPVLPVLINRNL